MRANRVSRRRVGVLLVLVGLALAVPVVTQPGSAFDAATLAAVGLVAVLAWTLHSRAASLAALALAVHRASEVFAPGAPLAFSTRLAIEAASSFLPPLAFLLLAVAVRRARAARLFAVAAVALALPGTAARLAALHFLWRPEGDAATILFALRYDAAASLWALAGLSVAAAGFVLSVAGHGKGERRARRRTVVAASTLAILVAGADGFALAGGLLEPRSDLVIGYHANRVSQVPDGAGLVHLEAAWASIQWAPGRFEWERTDRQLSEAAARGLPVYLLVNTYPPRWWTDAHPASVMVDREGEPFYWIDEAPGKARTRVWDVSFADPQALAAKRAFLAEAVARYGHHPAVRYVAVQNEPAYPLDWNLLRWASFDPFTVEAFRAALTGEAGGDLATLNARYGTEFASWSEVLPPGHPFGDYGERWIRFREDLLVSFVAGLVETARAATDRPVTVKMMAHFFTRFAEPQAGLGDRVYRALADLSDAVSVDLYPATRADLARSLRYFRELAGEKALIVAEFNLAFGLNVPGSAFRLAAALELLDEYADAVILFTAARHYLYEVGEGTPSVAAVRLHTSRPLDAEFHGALLALVREEWRNLRELPERVAGAAALARAA